MRKICLLSTLVLAMLYGYTSYSQDLSNKGKEFWIPYPEHIDGTLSAMGIYITGDVNTSGTIRVGAVAIPFTVTANQITRRFVGPNAGGDAPNTAVHMGGYQDGVGTARGIQVQALKPVVVFAHIIRSARSGASLILPVKVWGKEYILPSFYNTGGSTSFGELCILASQPNTQVEITPSVATRNGAHPPGVPFTITIPNVGDVYQLQFQANADLSGTKVKSIAGAGSGCNPIAVFSATTWSGFPCAGASGGDNLYQQLFPVGAWGKEFLTSPLKKNYTNPSDFNLDYVRVYVNDPATTVMKTEAGVTTPLTGLVTPGNFYQYTTYQPTFLSADRPVQVAQFVSSQTCGSPGTNSDPEMIMLSSVEQTINDITVFSAHLNFVPPGQSQVTNHYINVIMKTINTGNFTINGAPPLASFAPIPGTPYSYLKEDVTATAASNPVFRLLADSGFSAIAYGFGNVESYGYNAGTNVKDQYQQIGVVSQYGIEETPSVCVGSPFLFKVSLPYPADSIYWDLSQTPGPPPNVMMRYPPNTPDSTTVVNGKTLYWYSLPTPYTYSVTGTYQVTLTTSSPNTDGCGNEQEIIFDLDISSPPTASFNWDPHICVAEPVLFHETTPQVPKPTYHFWWSFGDPASGGSNTANVRNPTHTFTAPGTYTVRFMDITTAGCLSDTVEQDITIEPLPTATISGTIDVCVGAPMPQITFTGSGGVAPYTFTYNINGGAPLTVTTPVSSNIATVNVPTGSPGTFIYNLTEVKNTNSTVCLQAQTGSATVNVRPDATINLTSGNASQSVCINTAIANITYNIGGGGTNGTVTGLPPGVTGSFSGGVYTISGTPTVAGVYNFTVNTTGICTQTSANGTITVNPDAAISLTSGNNTQTVCINTAIANITYSISGGGTGGNVTGLPAGVTGTFSGGVLTISGTPTVSGTFNFTVNTTGTCVQASLGGTINVNPAGSLTLTSGSVNQSVCINTAISTITFTFGGAATTATVVGLPAGVTGTVSGSTYTISGTPTVAGTYNFTVTPDGTCGSTPTNGTITVNPDATLTLTSAPATTSQTVCINTAIAGITYAIGGGGTNGTVTGLPAGVTATFSGGVLTISGTPTVSGTFNYTLNTTGTCLQASANGSITVTPAAVINLTSGSNTQAVCVNVAIGNISYTLSGSATTASVTGLPPGVTGSLSGTTYTISGTPTVAGTYNFTVTPSGTCGVNPATGTIVVNPDATLNITSGTANQSVCINTPIVTITYAVGGGATNATVTGLPAGVTANYSGGVLTISGTPTANGTFNYTINTTGLCVQASANGSFVVSPNATLSLTSGSSNQTVCVNTAITNIVYSVGGSGTGGSATGLPAGVTGNFSGGTFTISGTPTVSGTFSYTINTTGSCGNATASGTITVDADATINLTSSASTTNQEICRNATLVNITYAIGGGGTGATVTGLPAGVNGSFAGGVFTISGAPTATGTFNYTVTTTGPCVEPTASGTITVNALPTSDFAVPAITCETRVIQFTDNSVPNAGALNSWSWNFGDPGSGAANTSNLQNPTHVFAAPGPYTVTLTVTTDKGCTSTQSSQTITINKNPTAAFSVPVICSSDPFAQFTDNSSITPGSVTGWQWNFGDPPSGAANTSTLQHPQHTYVNAGIYTVQLIATSNTGCVDTLDQPMTVNGQVTNASYTLQNTGNICSNQQVSLVDNSTLDFGSLVRLEIFWDYLNDPTIKTDDLSPLAGEVYAHSYPEFGAPLTRTFRVRYVAYSGANCFRTFDRDITLHATPTVVFNPITAICSDAPAFQITQASITNGLPGGPGVFTGPGVTSTGFFTPLTAGAGNHIIRYTYTGSNGCTNYKEQTLTVHPDPPANAGPDKVVLEGGQVTLTPALNASTPVTYLWSPATGIINPTIAMAVVSNITTDMTYTLTVTSDKGCRSTDDVFVKLLKVPLIPNIFSPNGDGIHDKWEIPYLESYPGCTIDIYNRYGQQIYHSEGYTKPWDGTVSGKPVPVGTYYYIINPKNGRGLYKGYVDVIR